MNAFPRNPEAGNRAHVVRAAFAVLAARAIGPNGNPDDVAATRWPCDETTGAVLRAVSSPMSTGDQGAFLQTTVRDFLMHMSASAASRLMVESLAVPLGRDAGVAIPNDASTAPVIAPWVSESAPIEVRSRTLATVDLGPARKLGTIMAASRTLSKQPGATALFGHILRETAAASFDAALFATTAADDDRVAGLLYDVDPLDAGPLGNMSEALAALAGALGDAGGSGRVVIAAHPTTAALIQLAHPMLTWPVLPTRALVAGHIVAIDPAGLAFGTGGEIDILATTAATVHMSDEPAEIVSDAPATADPVREIWQTDAIALRMLLDLTFAARPGAVQHVQGVTW